MKLHSPFIISARLLPALRIGDATLSLDSGAVFWLDLPDGAEHRISDYRPSRMCRDVVRVFDDILAFLSAAAEAYRYRVFVLRETEPSEDSNESLFPPNVVEWAYQNSSEIGCAQLDIQDESGAARAELIEA